MRLQEMLTNYRTDIEQEVADRKVMLQFLQDFDNAFKRENQYGHFTCSPWIINQDHTKVLMIYHNIYNSWGWCGGHCDGNENVLAVALKEGMEETGLRELKPVMDDIFSIEILPVPPHKKHGKFVSAHIHLNISFLCIADEKSEIRIKPDENSGVQWIAIDKINEYVSEEEMKIVYAKLVKKCQDRKLQI